MDIFYVYRHIRHDKNEPFYIGIGTRLVNTDHYKSKEAKYRRAYTKYSRSGFGKK